MGLYLCVFASKNRDDEIEGVEVGSYDDFYNFRSLVSERLEAGMWGSRFPTLMAHSDSDGEWTPEEAAELARELRAIDEGFAKLPPVPFANDSWQGRVATAFGVKPRTLAESFIDVDGELLIPRLRHLSELASERKCPISFQ